MAGAYCTYCGNRCFVFRTLTAAQVAGRGDLRALQPNGAWAGHMATCSKGMANDRAKTGHDHTTATNPLTTEAASPAPSPRVWHKGDRVRGGFNGLEATVDRVADNGDLMVDIDGGHGKGMWSPDNVTFLSSAETGEVGQ